MLVSLCECPCEWERVWVCTCVRVLSSVGTETAISTDGVGLRLLLQIMATQYPTPLAKCIPNIRETYVRSRFLPINLVPIFIWTLFLWGTWTRDPKHSQHLYTYTWLHTHKYILMQHSHTRNYSYTYHACAFIHTYTLGHNAHIRFHVHKTIIELAYKHGRTKMAGRIACNLAGTLESEYRYTSRSSYATVAAKSSIFAVRLFTS